MSVPTRQGAIGVGSPHVHNDLERGATPIATRVAEPLTRPGGPADLLHPPARRRRGRAWVQVLSYLATVFVLITINFALPRMMPGHPIDNLMLQGHPNYVQRPDTRERLAAYYHIDGSIPEQYGRYLSGLARGDLGVSVASSIPVGPELLDKLPWTILLILSATVVSVVIGLPAGVHSGWKRGQRADRGMLGVFMLWENIPVFVLGSLCFVVLAGKLHLFPYGGGVTQLNEYSGIAAIADIVRHLALPALVMGTLAASGHYLLMRSSMVSELGADYLLGGRAKGLRDRRLKYRYAGRNALLPVVTNVGLQVGMGITGVILIERIFAYPGVGGYMFGAIGTRDYPAMQGAFLLLTITVVTVNLLVDLLYRRLDPRTAT